MIVTAATWAQAGVIVGGWLIKTLSLALFWRGFGPTHLGIDEEAAGPARTGRFR